MVHNNRTITIVAGGHLYPSFLKAIQTADTVIGVDRGVIWLLSHSIIPDVAVGDFDSVTSTQMQKIKKKVADVRTFSPEKDKTDLELAVDLAIELRAHEVSIFGAIGTRFDHGFAGIHLLQKLLSHNIYGYIVDNFNKIYVVRRKLELKPSNTYRYVSLFPVTKRATVSLTGFRYEVSNHEFFSGTTLGVSNEIIATPAVVTVHSGTILLIQSRD